MMESNVMNMLRRAIRVLPAFAIAFGSLSAHAQSANHQSGGGHAALPAGFGYDISSYYDARYCEKVGYAFENNAMEKRWAAIARTIAETPGLSQDDLIDTDIEVDMTAPNRATVDTTFGRSKTTDKYRARYNACLASLQSIATTQSSMPSARQKSPSNPYINPYAPPRFIEDERKEMVRTGDANRFKALLDKDHTWAAYCLVTIDALYRLSEQNATALGFDPAKAADKQVLESIAERRKQSRWLFQLTFKKDQESLAREYVQKQLVNYNKGMDQHRSSTAEIGLYVKAQSTECDTAFGGWQGLTR